MSACGAAGILLLMLLINADVFGRAVFDAPIRGVPEFVSLSIVAIVFMQATHMLRTGRMIRSDSMLQKLQARHPRALLALDAVYHLLGALLFALLVRSSVPPLQEAWTDNLFVGAVGDFTLPTWPTRAAIVLGATMLCLQYAGLAWQRWRCFIGSEPAQEDPPRV